MSHPIILSDDEQEFTYLSPLPTQPKKRKIEPIDQNSTSVLVIDDDPTPRKPSSTSSPLFIPETPFSDTSIVKCTAGVPNSKTRVSSSGHSKFFGINGMICLESDNESENSVKGKNAAVNEKLLDFESDSELSAPCLNPRTFPGNANFAQMRDESSSHSLSPKDGIFQACHHSDERLAPDGVIKQKSTIVVNADTKQNKTEKIVDKKNSKVERTRLMEEKKRKKEQENLRKAALKAEALEMKKLEREKQKWEKGKFAVNSIVAEIDSKVVELGSVGGHLLSCFAEKGLTYRVMSNPIRGSIVWTMDVPEQISQLCLKSNQIPYVLLVYEAEEFCDLVSNETLMDHVSSVRNCYPSHTICYATNRLTAYIHKREQGQYKNPTSSNEWRCPPVEEVLSKMATHFCKVRSRLCVDEAELAEHVVGLTMSLASCQFRKKLTRLSVNANGSMVSKDAADKILIKKNTWLKALVAIPKVQPRFAMAIWKKYPTMKSLLRVYMDPNKTVHEKEFVLKDLMTEGLLGTEDRRVGEVCSKRIYRILMAQTGTIKTNDVEAGADFFTT